MGSLTKSRESANFGESDNILGVRQNMGSRSKYGELDKMWGVRQSLGGLDKMWGVRRNIFILYGLNFSSSSNRRNSSNNKLCLLILAPMIDPHLFTNNFGVLSIFLLVVLEV